MKLFASVVSLSILGLVQGSMLPGQDPMRQFEDSMHELDDLMKHDPMMHDMDYFMKKDQAIQDFENIRMDSKHDIDGLMEQQLLNKHRGKKIDIKIDRKHDKEIENLDWPQIVDIVLDRLDEDADYWENKGRGRHFEDDLSDAVNGWDELSPEEQEQIMQAICAVVFLVSLCGCLACLCVTGCYTTVACLFCRDYKRGKKVQKEVNRAHTAMIQRVTMAQNMQTQTLMMMQNNGQRLP